MYIPWEELWTTFDPAASFKDLLKRLPFRQATPDTSLKSFQPRTRLYAERDHFILKTVESSWELEAALRLRYRVFYQELLGDTSSRRLDRDPFDLHCDHLIIVDKRSSRIVGTYRLNASSYASSFYSSREFDLSELFVRSGIKLELGRACIDKDFRNGFMISLLWKGIRMYSQAIKARYLFGCSSVQTTDPAIVNRLRAYFRENGYSLLDMNLPVQSNHRFSPDEHTSEEHRQSPVGPLIPPLLMSYLKAGARVHPEPAYDRDFRCVDFLTVLDLNELNAAYQKRLRTR